MTSTQETMETQTATNNDGGGAKKTFALDEAFAYQHGRLTYHELTMKDRFPNVVIKEGEPALVETLKVGNFTREYKVLKGYPKESKTLFPQKYQWVVQQHNSDPSELEKQMAPDAPGSVFYMCDGNISDPSPTGIYNPMQFGFALVTGIADEMSGKNTLKAKTIKTPEKKDEKPEIVGLEGVEYHKVAYAVAQELLPIISDYAKMRGLSISNRCLPIGGGYTTFAAANAKPITPRFNAIWVSPSVQEKLHGFPPLFTKQDYIDLMGISGWIFSGNGKDFSDTITDDSTLRLLCYDRDYGIIAKAKRLTSTDRITDLESKIVHLKGFIVAASDLHDDETADKATKILHGMQKAKEEAMKDNSQGGK